MIHMTRKKAVMPLTVFTVTAISALTAFLLGTPALAAGKKRPSQDQVATPNPAKNAVVGEVGSTIFQLPNGANIDLRAELKTMLETAMARKSPFLRPTNPQDFYPCDRHIEVSAAVTALDMNIAQLGVNFGYSPEGATGTVSNVNAKFKVNIGTLTMDFHVKECGPDGCALVSASKANQTIANGELTVEIDFNQIHTAPQLLWATGMGRVLAKVMDKGVEELVNASNIKTLSWRANVVELDQPQNRFWIDAGNQSLIKTSQAFAVYAMDEGTNLCKPSKVVAYGHTTQVDAFSSVLEMDQVIESRGIKEGDIVTWRLVDAPK